MKITQNINKKLFSAILIISSKHNNKQSFTKINMASRFQALYNNLRQMHPTRLYLTGAAAAGTAYTTCQIGIDIADINRIITLDTKDGIKTHITYGHAVTWAPGHVLGGVLFGLTWPASVPISTWDYLTSHRR